MENIYLGDEGLGIIRPIYPSNLFDCSFLRMLPIQPFSGSRYAKFLETCKRTDGILYRRRLNNFLNIRKNVSRLTNNFT